MEISQDAVAAVAAHHCDAARFQSLQQEIATRPPNLDELLRELDELLPRLTKPLNEQRADFGGRPRDVFTEDDRWRKIRVPVLREGPRHLPEAPGASGDFVTTSLSHGAVSYLGEVTDDGRNGTVSWATASWHATVTFPAAPEEGVLSCRFDLSAEMTAYFPTGDGAFMATLSILDAATGSLAKSYWPINEPLPLSKPVQGAQRNKLTIEHTVNVKQGEQLQLPLVFVALAGVRRGAVPLKGVCNFAVHLKDTYDHLNVGIAEYKFDPSWWAKAKSDVTEFDKRHPFFGP